MTHADRDGSERELSAYLAADKAEPAPDADRPKWADLWGIDPDFELMPDPEVAALRAKVARVEALATSLAGRGKGKAFPETTAWATWASERIRAALAGGA